jgi:hypothetical protein
MNPIHRWFLAFLLPIILLIILDRRKNTEICNFDIIVIIKEYILRLYVAMDDILGVKVA